MALKKPLKPVKDDSDSEELSPDDLKAASALLRAAKAKKKQAKGPFNQRKPSGYL